MEKLQHLADFRVAFSAYQASPAGTGLTALEDVDTSTEHVCTHVGNAYIWIDMCKAIVLHASALARPAHGSQVPELRC